MSQQHNPVELLSLAVSVDWVASARRTQICDGSSKLLVSVQTIYCLTSAYLWHYAAGRSCVVCKWGIKQSSFSCNITFLLSWMKDGNISMIWKGFFCCHVPAVVSCICRFTIPLYLQEYIVMGFKLCREQLQYILFLLTSKICYEDSIVAWYAQAGIEDRLCHTQSTGHYAKCVHVLESWLTQMFHDLMFYCF